MIFRDVLSVLVCMIVVGGYGEHSTHGKHV